jgi:hypothetical protein
MTSISTSNNESKHVWSREETEILTRAFLDKKSTKEIQALLPEIKLSSIKIKLINCSHLEKASKKTVTKMHQDVWNELTAAFAVPDVDEAAEDEEDGETYFKCTGTCLRVMHYEDTDEFGMCGTCQYKSTNKKRK